jgi:RHS repeat-associated protein
MIATADSYSHDAFGHISSDTATGIESLFLFTARPFDADANLQNNLNRWYDLSTGRWMSADPIGFKAGDANLYRYVGNDVVDSADPTGNKKVDEVCRCAFLGIKKEFNPKITHRAVGCFSKTPEFRVAVGTNPGPVAAQVRKEIVCKKRTTWRLVFKCRRCVGNAGSTLLWIYRDIVKIQIGKAHHAQGVMSAGQAVGFPSLFPGSNLFVSLVTSGLTNFMGVTAFTDIVATPGNNDWERAHTACSNNATYYRGATWLDGDDNELSKRPPLPPRPSGISCAKAKTWPK